MSAKTIVQNNQIYKAKKSRNIQHSKYFRVWTSTDCYTFSSGSYYSHNDLRLHFGIGKATKINSIEVKWLGGGTDKISNVASNQIIKIKEGSVTRNARN